MTTTSATAETFPTHARKVTRGLRAAFTELFSTHDVDLTNHHAICRAIGINKNLAWRVSKIIQSDDPLMVVQHMPGSSGVKILLKACAASGATASSIEAAQEAVAAFESFVEFHSGDRATLQMMSPSLGSEGQRQADEHHRKMLFQGASYVWGAQAKTILKVGLVGPGSRPGLATFASLNALIDFRRFRPDVTWMMAARTSNNDDGSAMIGRTEAIDLDFDGPDQPPLVAEFCSRPLPELTSHQEPGVTTFSLVEGPVGNVGAQTCVFGTILRDMPMHRTPTNEWGRHTARCDTPSEQLILDLYIAEEFDFACPPEPVLVSQMGASPLAPSAIPQQLPLREPLQDMGLDALPLATPEVKSYNRMVEVMFERMGWSAETFRCYRMNVAYPACPTSIVLQYRLPEQP